MTETIIEKPANNGNFLSKRHMGIDPNHLFAMLLGTCLLVGAGFIAYWVYGQFNQLWERPQSVQLVKFFVTFATDNQGEVLVHQGEKVLTLPASASVFLGVVVAVVVLSLAIRVCFELLKHGLKLFFPNHYREIKLAAPRNE